MAEKKFKGAPFGIQTARFDVSGVHPKTKLPGTFTQIPYDKHFTNELKRVKNRENLIETPSTTSFSNIRQNLIGAVSDMLDIHRILERSKSRSSVDLPVKDNKEKVPAIVVWTNKSEFTSSKNNSCSDKTQANKNKNKSEVNVDNENNDTEDSPGDEKVIDEAQNSNEEKVINEGQTLAAEKVTDEGQSPVVEKVVDEGQNLAEEKITDEERNPDEEKITTEGQKMIEEKLTDEEQNSAEEKLTNEEQNQTGSPKTPVGSTQKEGTVSSLEVKENKDVIQQDKSDGDEPQSAAVSQRSSKIVHFDNEPEVELNSDDTLVAAIIKASHADTDPDFVIAMEATGNEDTFEIRRKSSHFSPLGSPPPPHEAPTDVLREQLEHELDEVGKNIGDTVLPVDLEVYTLPPTSAAKNSAHPNETEMESTEIQKYLDDVAKNSMHKLHIDHEGTNKEEEQVHTDTPEAEKVETSASKKTVVSVTEKSIQSRLSALKCYKRPSRVLNRETCDNWLKRKMGPGAYNTALHGYSDSRKNQKGGWARQLEVERLAAMPHLLHKEQWEENKLLKNKLGPGSYEIRDFLQLGLEKPSSERGICENLAPRFQVGQASNTPGPGTYGIGGIPQKAMELKNETYLGKKGLLDAGDRKRNLPFTGSVLGPGTYSLKSSLNEVLDKTVSLRGPYDLFTADRNAPLNQGYFAEPKLADLGPGQYKFSSFVDEMNATGKRHKGKFGKVAQHPRIPTDRVFLFSQQHYPKSLNTPGPGNYDDKLLPRKYDFSVNNPGFLSSSRRDSKQAQKYFTKNFSHVGPGRYDIQTYDECQDVNGITSVFKSKTGKPKMAQTKFLDERIRHKRMNSEDATFPRMCQPRHMSRSITIM